MNGCIYLLTKGGIEEIEYVLYDLKEALLKAQEMSLTIYRIRMRDGATVMKIYDPSRLLEIIK
jgi:hypothetical protein